MFHSIFTVGRETRSQRVETTINQGLCQMFSPSTISITLHILTLRTEPHRTGTSNVSREIISHIRPEHNTRRLLISKSFITNFNCTFRTDLIRLTEARLPFRPQRIRHTILHLCQHAIRLSKAGTVRQTGGQPPTPRMRGPHHNSQKRAIQNSA